MRSRRARGNDNTIERVLFDLLFDPFETIIGTGVEIVLGIDDIRQSRCVVHNRWDINDAGDVCSAMADEHSHSRLLSPHVHLGGIDGWRDEAPSRLAEKFHHFRCGCGSLCDGFGNILWLGEGSRNIDSIASRFNRSKRGRFAKTEFVQLHTERLGHPPNTLRWLHAHGENDEIILLRDFPVFFREIPDNDILRLRHFFHSRHAAPDVLHPLRLCRFEI